MIRFALACDKGHEFDSWFRDGASFEAQGARGLLECPHCGSTKVEKAIMAPSVARKDRAAGVEPVEVPLSATAPPAPVEQPVALLSPEAVMIRQKLTELREHLTRNSDNVGKKFAEEARKMHFGEIDPRTIHGEATRAEVEELLEEGVPVAPLPMLPEERN